VTAQPDRQVPGLNRLVDRHWGPIQCIQCCLDWMANPAPGRAGNGPLLITDIAVSRGTCKYRMATFNHCKYIYLLISDTYKELCSTQKSVRKCAVVCHLHSRQRAAIGRCPRRDPYFHNRGLTKRDRTGPIQLPKGNRLLLSHLGVSRDLLVAVIFQRRVGDLDQYCRSPSFPPSFAPLRLRAFA